MSERISRDELVRIYNIEITFFNSLEESGLLKTTTENDVKYLMFEDLRNLERFIEWHYDLDVNIPGLEVINNLMKQLDDLRIENRNLVNKMFGYVKNLDGIEFDE